MKNCLFEKLKGVVDNDNLFKLSDLVLALTTNPGNTTMTVTFKTKVSQTLKVTGDANFVDVSTGDVLGKTVQTGNANTAFSFRVKKDTTYADAESYLVLPNKEDIKNLDLDYERLLKSPHSTLLLGLVTLEIFIRKSSTNLIECKNIKDLPNVREITSYGETISGSLQEISNCPNLQILYLGTNSNLITGDAALMENGFRLLNTTSTIGWSSRDAGKSIITINGANLGDRVDQYLIDSAAGTNNPNVPGWQKSIVILGTRTSASDAAVTTLKGYGYTISVNGEQL